jgi:hypothetical protein
MPEPIFKKLGMYIMAPDPISTPCFINPSHQSVCLLLGNGWVKSFSAATSKHTQQLNNVEHFVFDAVLVVSKGVGY